MITRKLLFTPGPLTTSDTVKAAMLHDAGSRDADFLKVVREIRERLLALGGAKPGGDYECVLLQGSGTYAIESVISSATGAFPLSISSVWPWVYRPSWC